MKIKPISLNDASKIAKLEVKVFKDDAFSKELIEKLINNSLFFLKLEKKGFRKNLIGIVIVIKDRKDRVNIINFLINPKFQKKGFGALLLKQTLEKIEEINEIKYIVLNVRIDNEIAQNLYKKYGFQIIQKIDNYYKNKDSAFLMRKTILKK